MSALDEILDVKTDSYSIDYIIQKTHNVVTWHEAKQELAQLRNDNVKLNKLSQTQTESIAESTKYILQLRTENTRLQKAVDTARYILIDVDTYEDKNSPVIEDEVKAWLDSNKETK